MILFKGWGLLTYALLLVCFLGSIFVHDDMKIRSSYVTPAFFIAGGIINGLLGWAFNRAKRKAGVKAWNRHSVFWIPMEWWSVLFILLAVILYRSYR